jgi:hypothetical protein
MLDLDGDGQNGHEHRSGKAAWKSYDRFTLRVSWPASVSPHTQKTQPRHYAFTEFIFLIFEKYPVQVKLSLHRPVISSTAPSSARTDIAAPRRLHLARIRLEQEGVPVPQYQHAGRGAQHREKEGVPLVVLLEPLVLGVLPASVLPIVVTLLGVLGAAACSVLPCVLGGMLGEVVERARREITLLGESKGKEKVD